MTDIRTNATAVYDTLLAVESSVDSLPDSPEKDALIVAMGAHHTALNFLRQLLGMTWDEFLVYIDRETPAARQAGTLSGGTNKNEPPAPGGK